MEKKKPSTFAATISSAKRFMRLPPQQEAEYRRYAFETLGSWLQRCAVAVALCFLIISVVYFAFSRPTRRKMSTLFGDIEALGLPLADASMITPTISSITTALLMHTRYYNQRTYVAFLSVASFGTMFAFAWPVHYCELSDASAASDATHTIAPIDLIHNCSESLTVQSSTLVYMVVVRTLSHVGISLAASIGIAFFAPEARVASNIRA